MKKIIINRLVGLSTPKPNANNGVEPKVLKKVLGFLGPELLKNRELITKVKQYIFQIPEENSVKNSDYNEELRIALDDALTKNNKATDDIMLMIEGMKCIVYQNQLRSGLALDLYIDLSKEKFSHVLKEELGIVGDERDEIRQHRRAWGVGSGIRAKALRYGIKNKLNGK